MKHDVEREQAGSSGGARHSAALLAFGVGSAMLALIICCIACNAVGAILPDGALRSWYLPLGLFLAVLRVGARRNSRRPLSLALFLLGLGALTARAYDARGADATRVGTAAPGESPSQF